MDDVVTPRSLTARVAAFDLADVQETIDVPPHCWMGFLSCVSSENLTGLAHACVEAGRLPLNVERYAELRAAHVEAVTRTLALERALILLDSAMETEGVPFVVLKGPALSYRFYPDPAWRSYTDVDVLVRAGDWRRACRAVEQIGFRRDLPEPRPGFDERFGKAALHVDGGGLGIDLHRTLVLGPFGIWVDTNELFDRTVPFDIAGRTMRRFDDTTMLLHACMHASLGWTPPLLLPVRDVMQVATTGRIDWERFRVDAARWRLGAVVEHAFRTVRDVMRVALPTEATPFLDMQPTRRERRALAAYVTSRRGRGGTELSTLRAVSGIRAKAAFARDLLFPDEAFLSARAGTDQRPSYVRRWATPVRWVLRRSR